MSNTSKIPADIAPEISPEVAKFATQLKDKKAQLDAAAKEAERRASDRTIIEDNVPQEYKNVLEYLKKFAADTQAVNPELNASLSIQNESIAIFNYGLQHVTVERFFDNELNNGTNPALRVNHSLVYYPMAFSQGFGWRPIGQKGGDKTSREVASLILSHCQSFIK
jgi:ABC-type transporter Mla subunit MlaD